jgi:enterochelin esterase-like enzyme
MRVEAAMVWLALGLGCDRSEVSGAKASASLEARGPSTIDAISSPLERRTFTFELGAQGLAPRAVTLVLPERFDDEARYPVLVVYDGQHLGSDGFDLVAVHDRLVRDGLVRPHVIVGVASTEDRTAEYTFSRSSYEHLRELERARAASIDERLADFVIEDVLPMVATHARIETDREHHAALGFSYGGLAALHLALRWPDRFGRVICHSPSLWWSAKRTIAEFASYRGPSPHRLWVDVGTLEGNARDVVPYMVGDARALVRAAELRGMRLGRDLGYREIPNEDHDTGGIRRRLESALGFGLSDRTVDLDRADDASLLVFSPVLRSSEVTSFTLALDFGGGLSMTPPVDRVHLSVRTPAVVRTDDAGHVRALSIAGTSTLVARFGAVEETTRVRVR